MALVNEINCNDYGLSSYLRLACRSRRKAEKSNGCLCFSSSKFKLIESWKICTVLDSMMNAQGCEGRCVLLGWLDMLSIQHEYWRALGHRTSRGTYSVEVIEVTNEEGWL